MKTNQMPKTIANYVARHPDKFDVVEMEYDEFGGFDSPYSVWAYLKPGFCTNLAEHAVHELTVKEFLERARSIRVCECDDCKKLMEKTNA